jgi:hypothetical protein
MAYTLVDSLVRASIPAVVLTVFALARRFFPAKSAREFGTTYSIEELNVRFRSKQWLFGVGMVLTGTVIALGTHFFLASLNRLGAVLDGPAELVLPPQAAIWWILPIFAGIAMAWETTLGLWSLLGDKKEAALYAYWTMATAGLDAVRVLRLMVVVIGLPGIILTFLAIPEHDVLRHEDLRERRYGFSSVKIYRYSEARRMTVIQGFRDREGKLVSSAGIVLDFADGRRWSSADMSDFKPSIDPVLLRYIQTKTGLEPQYAEAESDIPGRKGNH